ncbi:TetR/AcrR family transcriptional regulator [Nocardioides daeguensis]|uniref:TetR/AcrR family transcriptional regulator n=1 Tax=Nocardioides daeguensis TaxID=908359 RepID=A0ABP6WAH4_9ACTN|nr:TetR/AcrR family transcriptional regulator [Nocardioides daeguensis]MBV6728083.1 TetR/AcrR family transcriptional regulator [Nocardioides daeguensis]MCR1774157.1 TetR/AcrR family transcriptional regulator [Nocardioides daeguensis]
MSTTSTGAGEPSRTLALLWGDPSAGPRRKGPGRSVSVEQLVEAALALADERGLAAVTTRAVAERVGISAMSLYTYVPGKPELLDLMVDAVYLAMPRPAWRSRSWRSRLTRVAEANRELLRAHPWLTEVAALSRPPLGPGVLAKYEHELAAYDGTGLGDVDTDAALSYLLGFVHAHCRAAHDAARASTDSAMSDADWWAANQPILARAFDPATYPRAVRVGAAAGAAQGSAWDADRAWRFGLARTLDGLAALIEGPRAPRDA